MGLRLQGFIFTMGRVSGPTYWKHLSYYIPQWSWTWRQQIRNIFSQRKRKECFLYYSTDSQTLTGVSSMCEMVSPYGKEMFFTTWPHADLHPLNMTDTICVTAAPSCHCQSLNVLMSSSADRNTPHIFSDRVISRAAFLLFESSESCHRQFGHSEMAKPGSTCWLDLWLLCSPAIFIAEGDHKSHHCHVNQLN